MSAIFDRLKKTKILVVGDIILDKYWLGQSSRISPEAPVPIVDVENISEKLGGAGNVAGNAASLGCGVSLLGLVGDDREADSIQKLLAQASINSLIVRHDSYRTVVKLRVISQGQQLIRLDFEEPVAEILGETVLQAFLKVVERHDLIILSDYCKGSLNDVKQIVMAAKQLKKTVVVDPKGGDFSRYAGADLVTPNLKEFETIVGKCPQEFDIASKAIALMKRFNIRNILVTRGHLGMSLVSQDGTFFHIPTEAEDVFDVTGAGDTVCGVIGAMLAIDFPLRDSVNIANQAAGLVVKKLGASTIKVEDLALTTAESVVKEKFLSLRRILEECKKIQKKGSKIVLTNGCFDILHAGHVNYLEEAKKLGDCLVVALNSDESVRLLKGETRPVNCLEHRALVLSAMESIDWIVPFDEMTPINVVRALLPDVLVKGGDYELSQVIGYKEVIENGGEVKILDFFPSNSTTSIIKLLDEL